MATTSGERRGLVAAAKVDYCGLVPHALLINPSFGSLFSGRVRRYNRRFPPLCLLHVAGAFRERGWTVRVIDERAEPGALLRASPGDADLVVLALSPLDRWQCPNVDFDALDTTVARLPHDRLVVYGAQVTTRPEWTLDRLGVSRGVVGEPEAAMCALAVGEREVPALVQWDGVHCTTAEPAPLASLDALPFPAFDLLDARRYRYEVLGDRLALFELTRGCPWRCRFCLLSMYGKKYRRKTIDRMMVEIRAAWAAGFRTAYFQDLEFTIDHTLVTALCEALRRSGLPLRWACQTRPDTVDAALLTVMRAAGCELIHFGVESGVPAIVERTDKGQSLDAVRRAVAEARAVGMRTLCYFLLGLPGESLADMHATLRFAEALGPTYASFQVATPYPGTPFHAEVFGEGGEPFPDHFPGPLSAPDLRALARQFTVSYHLGARGLRRRLKDGGVRSAGREAALLIRYAAS